MNWYFQGRKSNKRSVMITIYEKKIFTEGFMLNMR